MLISHRKKFIYTKTVKTAGTSVESYFEKYCMPEGEWTFSHAREEYVSREGIIGYRGVDATGKKWYNHMPASEIRENIGDSIWGSYYKFCVIRNPFDKLVSGFFFFEEAKCENLVKGFRDWVRAGGALVDRDKYVIDDEPCLDYFIRYEQLEDGIRHVCDQLDLPFEPENIPRLKAGIRDRAIPTSDYYDEKTEQIVRDVYAFEIDRFGYDMPDSSGGS